MKKEGIMKKFILVLWVILATSALTQWASILVHKPNGNEKLALGKKYTIVWAFFGTPHPGSKTVQIDLYKGGTARTNRIGTIAQNLPIGHQNSQPTPSGSFAWKVGTYKGGSALPGSNYYIRVVCMQNILYDSDFSDSSFSLTTSDPFNTGDVIPHP